MWQHRVAIHLHKPELIILNSQFLMNDYSPLENQNDLELDFKVFFFIDSCCSDIVLDESK